MSKKIGRPLLEHEPRTTRIDVWVTPTLRREIDDLRGEVTLADWVRARLVEALQKEQETR